LPPAPSSWRANDVRSTSGPIPLTRAGARFSSGPPWGVLLFSMAPPYFVSMSSKFNYPPLTRAPCFGAPRGALASMALLVGST
jgi:hypothetical protein